MKSHPTKCNPDVMKVSSQMRPATRPVWGKKKASQNRARLALLAPA